LELDYFHPPIPLSLSLYYNYSIESGLNPHKKLQSGIVSRGIQILSEDPWKLPLLIHPSRPPEPRSYRGLTFAVHFRYGSYI